MANSRETIRDWTGKIIGFIDTDNEGNKTVRDFYGRITGRYDKRFNVTSSLLNQELYKINAAIVNHFITINALEMARDDLIPLIGSEVIIGTGFISNNNAMQITNDVIGLFQAILAQNVEQTKIMLERLNNMPNIDVTKLNANVNGYIEMLEEKNRSLEM